MSHLHFLDFKIEFNESLNAFIFPQNLQTLNFGHNFNQSLEGVEFPNALQHLSFGDEFNQSFKGVVLPQSLQTLSFGSNFNQSLEGGTVWDCFDLFWGAGVVPHVIGFLRYDQLNPTENQNLLASHPMT